MVSAAFSTKNSWPSDPFVVRVQTGAPNPVAQVPGSNMSVTSKGTPDWVSMGATVVSFAGLHCAAAEAVDTTETVIAVSITNSIAMSFVPVSLVLICLATMSVLIQVICIPSVDSPDR